MAKKRCMISGRRIINKAETGEVPGSKVACPSL